MRRNNNGTHHRFSRLGAALVALVLLASACGDDSGTDAEAANEGSAPVEAAQTDDTGTSDGDQEPVDDPSSGGDEPAAAPAGNGAIIADTCSGGQFVNGAISIDDLVGWGVFSSADVNVDGASDLDAIGYNDFGFLCNIEASDGGDFLTVGITSGSDTYDDTAGRETDGPTLVGDWQYYVLDGLTPLVMLHTDAEGNQDTLFVNWFPADDSRRNLDENTRVLGPLAEAIATQTTVDIPRVAAPGTPSWFACDSATAGAAGVSPAALFAAAEGPEGRELEVEQSIQASFSFTQCKVRPTVGFLPVVTVQVQDSSAQLQDTLETFLSGWPDAVAETIAGIDVAVRIDDGTSVGTVFTVLDGTPMEIRISGDGNSDLGAPTRAAAELVLSAVS